MCYHGASVGREFGGEVAEAGVLESILVASVCLRRFSGRWGVYKRRGEKLMAFMSR